jgi:hypothetical protein
VTEWLVAIGIFAIVALSRVWARRKQDAERRALLAVPETPIAGITDGARVRIRGRAVARDSLVTAYRLTFEYRNDPVDGWRNLVEDDAFNRFVVVDDTGEATVHAPFTIKLAPYRDAFVAGASAALASLLARKGVPAIELFGTTRQLRYVETIVMPGDEVMAVGRASIEIDPAGRAPSNRDPPVMCQLKGTTDEPVIIAAPT